MSSCFGYIRVSTQKQGEGVSLDAQKEAIQVFASQRGLTITKWFEEKQTAAKGGRPIFNQMLRQLRRGAASGVIIHKIDRSARNLRDWAMFSELPDAGVNVYVATESLDFTSRGGRLTADIQAVIAADYIRNLREETIKGIQGRLKQGLYPFKAPVGYLDQGRGKPKVPDPKTAPIIREMFRRYSTGQETYMSLIDWAERRGLRNQKGGPLSLHGIETILGNPFYAGLIRIKRTGQSYPGIHDPIITISLYEEVEAVRTGRRGQIKTRHQHLFRRLFSCGHCDGCMIPELQKGRVYYRCKSKACPTKTIREDAINAALRAELERLELTARSSATVQAASDTEASDLQLQEARTAIELQIEDEVARQERLTDLLIDGTLERTDYSNRKAQSEQRLLDLKQRLAKLPSTAQLQQMRHELAELQKNLCLTYERATADEKREFIQDVWPNRKVFEKRVVVKPFPWLQEAVSGNPISFGDPVRGHGRTFGSILELSRKALKRETSSKAPGDQDGRG
ncbi:recombinase family protein [Marimonas sp. MJW-29]|uniref:Recombinase family protein n=1 Tax=Sulfitobacter sediminis TaxID=3234186 RepID=A0ABV3RQ69_9RHOB